MAFCKYCGNPLTEDAKFCPNCGAPRENNLLTGQPRTQLEYQQQQELYRQIYLRQQTQLRPMTQAGNDPRTAPVPPTGSASQASPKGKQKIAKSTILTVILCVVTLSLIAALIVWLALGGINRDALGVYRAVECKLDGVSVDCEGDWVELKAWSRATVHVLDDDFTCKWERNGSRIILSQYDSRYYGSVRSGVLALSLGRYEYVFCRSDGNYQPETLPDTDDPNRFIPIGPTLPQEESIPEQLQWWDGDWYGWWILNDGTGRFADVSGNRWDVCAAIRVHADSTGSFRAWDSDNAPGEALWDVEVSFLQGTAPQGRMASQGGSFMNMPLASSDLLVDPDNSSVRVFENMLCICGTYQDPEDSATTFRFHLFLRPWGMEWEDVKTADSAGLPYEDMMPPGYDSWYLPRIQAGQSMPESFREE